MPRDVYIIKGKLRCGAPTRSKQRGGAPCKAQALNPARGYRCKMHGGAAPKTADAMRRQLEGLARGREIARRNRDALKLNKP
jgi:hypothetical protein